MLLAFFYSKIINWLRRSTITWRASWTYIVNAISPLKKPAQVNRVTRTKIKSETSSTTLPYFSRARFHRHAQTQIQHVLHAALRVKSFVPIFQLYQFKLHSFWPVIAAVSNLLSSHVQCRNCIGLKLRDQKREGRPSGKFSSFFQSRLGHKHRQLTVLDKTAVEVLHLSTFSQSA